MLFLEKYFQYLKKSLKKLEQIAAGGIVLSQNKILLVKNKKGDSSADSEPWWGYPKGHLEEGEKPSEAAVREVYEETGFLVKNIVHGIWKYLIIK